MTDGPSLDALRRERDALREEQRRLRTFLDTLRAQAADETRLVETTACSLDEHEREQAERQAELAELRLRYDALRAEYERLRSLRNALP